MTAHYPAHIWQERLGEFSWRCRCGHVHKHVRFPGHADIAFPRCPGNIITGNTHAGSGATTSVVRERQVQYEDGEWSREIEVWEDPQ